MPDPILDGFRILERLSKAEIESRLAWLEEAVHVYRLLLTVKEVSERHPPDMTPGWESVLDVRESQSEPQPKPSSNRGRSERLIVDALLKHPEGARCSVLALETGLTPGAVNVQLSVKKHLFERVGGGVWRVKMNGRGGPVLPPAGG